MYSDSAVHSGVCELDFSSVQFVRCKQALTVYYKLPTFVECYYYDTYWQFNDVDLMRSIRFTLSTLVP